MNSRFLRRALIADGAISGATGLLMLLGAGFLTRLLGLPAALLNSAGLILIPFAGAVLYLATRDRFAPAAVRTVMVLNVAWAVASAVLLISGAIAPNLLGYTFIVVQAVTVAIFAEMQYVGLRRTGAVVA